MKALISKTLVLASVLALSSAAVWAAGADETAAPAAASAGAAMNRVVSQMWWNQSAKVTALGLTSDQRSQLDSLGRAYLEGRRDSTSQRAALDAFSAALKQDDLETARDQARALAEASAEPHLAQAEMMVEALSMLSAEQRQKIVSNFPGLLEGPWMRTGANLRQRRGAQRGQ